MSQKGVTGFLILSPLPDDEDDGNEDNQGYGDHHKNMPNFRVFAALPTSVLPPLRSSLVVMLIFG